MHLYNVFILILFILLLIQNNNAIEISPSFINQHEIIKPRAPETSSHTSSTIHSNNSNAISTIHPTTTHPTTTITTTTATATTTTTLTTSTESPSKLNKIPVSEFIDLEFDCGLNRTDLYFCNVVQNSTTEAIKEIDKVLLLHAKIIVKVAYFSFCDVQCNNNSFGRGIPTEQFTFPYKDGVNFVYSQALTKQAYKDTFNNYNNQSDISIEINHDKYMESVNFDKARNLGWNGTGIPPTGIYWFGSDTRYNQTTIEDYQIDMEYIILHQIIHGLGFVSAWAPYFWASTSPFKELVSNMKTPEQIQIVTPAMYWYIDQGPRNDGGPLYITGFRPTMVFDKFLYSINTEETSSSSPPAMANLTAIGLDVQNFCVKDPDSFILNFLNTFSTKSQYQDARTLWNTMGMEESLYFVFENQNQYYHTDPFLSTYTNMTLLTGTSFIDITIEQYDETSNRPGATIFHLDNKYNTTVDFLMTQNYFRGQTLADITQEAYQNIPTIYYNRTTSNHTNITLTYQSPVGPGILHILDSIGYATVLSNVNTSLTLKTDNGSGSDSNSNATNCDVINSGPSPKAPSFPSSSHGNKIILYHQQQQFCFITLLSIIISLLTNLL